mmetsp:Transcript_5099/g.17786  ORF Transcript_5099/g.17786 Transcript_5099/m.17786 type:complete len:209 (-) Transcript_5099:1000-1626(-)
MASGISVFCSSRPPDTTFSSSSTVTPSFSAAMSVAVAALKFSVAFAFCSTAPAPATVSRRSSTSWVATPPSLYGSVARSSCRILRRSLRGKAMTVAPSRMFWYVMHDANATSAAMASRAIASTSPPWAVLSLPSMVSSRPHVRSAAMEVRPTVSRRSMLESMKGRQNTCKAKAARKVKMPAAGCHMGVGEKPMKAAAKASLRSTMASS